MKVPGYLPWGLNYPERLLVNRVDITVNRLIRQGVLREESTMLLFQLACRRQPWDSHPTNVRVDFEAML